MTLARAFLTHRFGPMGVKPARVKGAWRQPDRRMDDGYAVAVRPAVDLYISFLLYFHLPFPQGFSFLSAESNSVLIHFLFHYLLSFTQAVGITILSSSALHRSFCRTFRYSFSSISIFDTKQTWETSFGMSTPVLSLSLRVFVSPSCPSSLHPGSPANLATRVAIPIACVPAGAADTFWAGFWGLIWRKFFWDFVGGTLRDPGGFQ